MNMMASFANISIVMVIFIISCSLNCSIQPKREQKQTSDDRLMDEELAFFEYFQDCPNWKHHADVKVPSTILFSSDVCLVDTDKAEKIPEMTSSHVENSLRAPTITNADGLVVTWGDEKGFYYVLMESSKEVQSLMRLVKVDKQKQDTPGAYSCLSSPDGSAIFYKLEGTKKKITEILTITCDWYSIAGLEQKHGYGQAYLADTSQKAIRRFLAARKINIRPEILRDYYMDREKRVDVVEDTDTKN